jgi:formate hydrogenlyase subunit 6/NADH:ubiquinone oxidoreductase subunit I
MAYLRTIAGGLRSLLVGMGVTARQIRRKPVTLAYPHQKPELSKAYRSAIKLVRFDESQTHDCVACMQCVTICPSACITIEGGKVEGLKRKRATRVEMDFALCSLCGLCIDVCPTDTLEYSRLYDDVGRTRDWNMDLLAEFRDGEEAFLAAEREKAEREAAEKAATKAAADAARAAAAAEKAEAEAGAAAPPAAPGPERSPDGGGEGPA